MPVCHRKRPCGIMVFQVMLSLTVVSVGCNLVEKQMLHLYTLKILSRLTMKIGSKRIAYLKINDAGGEN